MRKEKLRLTHLDCRAASGKGLEDVCLNLYEGEALGVLGLHDAGKSTLLQVIAGRRELNGGRVFWDEEPVEGRRLPFGPRVALIERQSSLVGNLSVAENIFVLRRHRRPKLFLNRKPLEQQARCRLAELRLDIDPRARASRLSSIQKYMIEIVKAYILGANLILIDDFAREYSQDAYGEVARLIEALKDRGVSFIATGSQWRGLSIFCDRIAILDRRHIGKIVPATAEGLKVAEGILLGGAQEMAMEPRARRVLDARTDACLRAEGLQGKTFKAFSFELYPGEVLALYDPRKRALDELFSILQDPRSAGGGRLMARNAPYDPRARFPRVVATDFNMEKRFISSMSVRDNLCMNCYPRMSQAGMLREKRMRYVEKEFARWYGDETLLGLRRCSRLHEQEKIAIYLFALRIQNPQILICADPGVATDFIAGQRICRELRRMAENGAAVLVLASLMSPGEWADRVLVLPSNPVET